MRTISILFNGEKTILESENTVEKFIADQKIDRHTPYALAINLDFVPKSQYSNRILKEGDRVEIVVAHPGG